MTLFLRLAATVLAIAGVIDPAIAWRRSAPLAIRLFTPRASHPDAARAGTLRTEIVRTLGDEVEIDGSAQPGAIVLIGDAAAPPSPGVPVFAIRLPARSRSTSILAVSTPAGTIPGQEAYVSGEVRGSGLAGRRSSLILELGGAPVETIQHRWTREDETFRTRWSFVPPSAGVHRVRVVVRTEGIDGESVADAVVVARDRRLDVLAYEPRPSWPLAFVRRSLEAEALFTVASASRTSRPVATASTGAPRALDGLDDERFQAVLVGALEELREADLRTLDRFVSERGGTLILLPDRQVPEPVRRRFDLPRTEEVLLENPASVHHGGLSLRASELLLSPATGDSFDSIATVRQGTADRAAIVSVNRGRGRVVLSGALDAWRYRADQSGGFDRLWHGIVADAALSAAPRFDVRVTPSIARPGDDLRLTATARGSVVDPATGGLAPVAASLISEGGRRDMIRLWPGAAQGAYEATFAAQGPGAHSVSATMADITVTVPFLVADDAVHPAQDSHAASVHAARASGGAVVENVAALRTALADLEPAPVEQAVHPMRSAWWLLPFAGLLCAEWALRRRSGLT